MALGIAPNNAKAYAEKFYTEAVSLEDIREGRIGPSELAELGVKIGDRPRMLQSLRATDSEEPPTEQQPLLASVSVVSMGGPVCVNHPNARATVQCV